jgi:HSP20 family protein
MSVTPWRRTARGVDPFAFHAEMDRLFESLWQGFDVARALARALEGSAAPRIAVSETDAEIQVEAELPGLTEKDFEVALEGSLLLLKGEKRSEQETEGSELRHVERSFGRFERKIELPCEVDADKVSASYKHELLRVTLPKLDAGKRGPREIEVRSA